MKVIRLTEGDLVKIIEQVVALGSAGNMIRPGFDLSKSTPRSPSGKTPDTEMEDGVISMEDGLCEVKKPMDMIVKEIFSSLEKSSTSSSNEKVKKYINRLKNSMEGLGSTDDVYNVFREIKDKETISSIIKNWKSVTKSNDSLYEWISSEITIRWVILFSILQKNNFYGVKFNPCIRKRKLYN